MLSYAGQCYEALNNFKKAIEYSGKVLKIDPKNVEVIRILQRIYSETKKYGEDAFFCTECGNILPGDAKFCKECGSRISND